MGFREVAAAMATAARKATEEEAIWEMEMAAVEETENPVSLQAGMKAREETVMVAGAVARPCSSS